MKANAPEKLYISPISFEIGEVINSILTTKSEGDIEYIRADAFIEKACAWLSNVSLENMEYKYDGFDTSEGWYKMIDDFRNYMEGE